MAYLAPGVVDTFSNIYRFIASILDEVYHRIYIESSYCHAFLVLTITYKRFVSAQKIEELCLFFPGQGRSALVNEDKVSKNIMEETCPKTIKCSGLFEPSKSPEKAAKTIDKMHCACYYCQR